MDEGIIRALIGYIMFGPFVMLMSMMLGTIVVVGIFGTELDWASSKDIIYTFTLGFFSYLIVRAIITFIRTEGTPFERFEWIFEYSKSFIPLLSLSGIFCAVINFVHISIVVFFLVWLTSLILLSLYLRRRQHSPDMTILFS